MAGINKAIIIGHLGRDPEIRYTASGQPVASFSVATTEVWKDRSTGEKKEQTQWFQISAFDRLAEICGQYLSKGRQVYIEGRIRGNEWEDKEGNKRFSINITASTLQMLGTKDSVDAPPQQKPAYRPEPQPEPSYVPQGPPEDDIPF